MKMHPTTTWQDLQENFLFHNHGKIRVRKHTSWFGFQIRARSQHPRPHLIFALLNQLPHSVKPSAMFGVRVDLENGEIIDIANRTGVIGRFNDDVWPNPDEEFPIMLRWEVEHTGDALIPRLHIGAEEWLYPTVLFPGDSHFIATTGHNLHADDADCVFSPGYVWCQDRLREPQP